MLKKIFNIISGLIIALGPISVALIIGFFIYNEYQNNIGIAIWSILVIAGSIAGYKIFRRVLIVGPLEVLAETSTSRELDNLQPTENSDFKLRTPMDFIELVSNNAQLFKGGTFRIYGDWFGKPYDNHHSIDSATYDENEKILTLNFNENEKITIWNPKIITEATTYFKIQKADKIKLEWYYYGKEQTKEHLYFKSYHNKSNKISTLTNIDWYNHTFDVSIAKPALMIYG